ncbi:hypothetical protein V9T40_005573 [Parthenolecanium corni]|uniref:Major facilitator superfamily (MFS) profile domain-containing protein n=1 Tax=Parthenolecanium corni TaxID=536013 RepID=A0AAN9TT42_9HEMI
MEPQSGKFYLQKRYLVALLGFIAWGLLFLMRTNLSISIVDMTSNRTVTVGNETITQVAEFDWSSKEKGVILSAFSWGFTTAPLGAFLTRRFGGVSAFGMGVALTGLLTVLTPLFMKCHLYVYIAARVMEGVSEGIAVTSYIEAIRAWSTPKDRSRLMGVSMSGYAFGVMLGYPVCGTIAYYMNWKGVFYITGGISITLSLIWFALIRNSPGEDNLMSLQEKKYLQQVNTYASRKNLVYPWKQIFKSKAVWAYWNERFVGAFSESFFTFSLPFYIKDVHDVNIQDIGFIAAMPHIFTVVALLYGSFLADFLRNRGILSPSNVSTRLLIIMSYKHNISPFWIENIENSGFIVKTNLLQE